MFTFSRNGACITVTSDSNGDAVVEMELWPDGLLTIVGMRPGQCGGCLYFDTMTKLMEATRKWVDENDVVDVMNAEQEAEEEYKTTYDRDAINRDN